MDPAQRARIAAKADTNAKYVAMMARLRGEQPPASIRRGPANHGSGPQQQADALAAQHVQKVKQEFDLAGWLNKNAEISKRTAAAEKERLSNGIANRQRERDQRARDEYDYIRYGLPADQQDEAYLTEQFEMGW